jgi:hypothetical protein
MSAAASRRTPYRPRLRIGEHGMPCPYESSSMSKLFCWGGLGYFFAEIFVGALQAFFQGYLWLPIQDAFGFGDVWAALLGIVLRERVEDDGSGDADKFADAFGKFQDGDFLGIADVGGLVLV